MELAAKDRLLKHTGIFGVGFFLIAMCLVLYFSINKKIEITNVGQDSVERAAGEDPAEEGSDRNRLLFEESAEPTDYLCIPLTDKIDAEDIVIENHYMDSELIVQVGKADEDFYRTRALTGNRQCITDGFFEPYGDGIRLRFRMDGIYEYRTVLENSNLYISFLNPRELYEKIVVIDPGCGGSDAGFSVMTEDGSGNPPRELTEKEITLDVARKLKDLLETGKIKAYYTRMDDVNPPEMLRVRLANETHADMYIVIGTDEQTDESVYGISAVYNDAFFIPGFGSIELADTLLRNVTVEARDRALGLVKAPTADYCLRHATVPASRINVGCLSNKQEAILLQREDYRQRLAEGIYQGIINAYDIMEGK